MLIKKQTEKQYPNIVDIKIDCIMIVSCVLCSKSSVHYEIILRGL